MPSGPLSLSLCQLYSVLLQTTSSIWWGTWLLTALVSHFMGTTPDAAVFPYLNAMHYKIEL